MDQLKTVRGQELTHPLQYNREQTDTIQKEKVMHSKFKGTAGVTGESVKSEEIQVSCKINTLFSSMNVLVFRYHMDLSHLSPVLLTEDGCVYSEDFYV